MHFTYFVGVFLVFTTYCLNNAFVWSDSVRNNSKRYAWEDPDDIEEGDDLLEKLLSRRLEVPHPVPLPPMQLPSTSIAALVEDLSNYSFFTPPDSLKHKYLRRTRQNGRRPHLWFKNFRTDTERQRCYFCGAENGIPRSNDCYSAFDSGGSSSRMLVRKMRAVCNYDKTRRFGVERWPGHLWVYSRSIRNHRSQNHGSGCFKYYLDVGEVYTIRGCRLLPKFKDSRFEGINNFAWHRFRALEKQLLFYQNKHKVYNNCMVSPHASLTPFARGISLWARYYVCLCYTDYCNSATKFFDVYVLLVLLVLLNLVIM